MDVSYESNVCKICQMYYVKDKGCDHVPMFRLSLQILLIAPSVARILGAGHRLFIPRYHQSAAPLDAPGLVKHN